MRPPPKPAKKFLAGSFLNPHSIQLPPGVKPMPSPVKRIVAPHPLQVEIDACLAEIAEENGATFTMPIPAPRPVPESLLDFTHPLLHFDPAHVLRYEDLRPEVRVLCASLEHLPVKPKRGRPTQGEVAKTGAERVAESRARALHESLAIRQMKLQADAQEKFWREEHAAGRLTHEHMEELIQQADAEVEQAAHEWQLDRQRERWSDGQRVTNPGYGRFMADAPEGMGELIYDSESLEPHRRDGRVTPSGAGPEGMPGDND